MSLFYHLFAEIIFLMLNTNHSLIQVLLKEENMKKVLMASLIMAMTGVASAQVTLSGKISEFADTTKVGGTRTTQIVTEPTSNFAISANEKLGNGLTARAVVETSLSGNTIGGTGTQIGDRQSTVGLAHSFGSVDLGRNVHSQFLAVSNNDVFGTLYGSVAGDVHNLRNLRLSDAVFIGLNPMKNVSVAYERSQVAAGQDATVMAVSGNLFKVSATVARYVQGAETSTVLGANTVVSGTVVTYVHSADHGVVTSKGDSIGVARGFGPIMAKATYGRTSTDVRAYAIGADYALSKRTSLTAAYRVVNRAGTAQDVKQIGVGLTHRF